MLFAIFHGVVQKHEQSPTVELWLASRMSVFIEFQKKIRTWATFNHIYNTS